MKKDIYDSTVTINDGTTSVTFTFKNGASASTDIEAGDILATSVTAQGENLLVSYTAMDTTPWRRSIPN